MNIYSLHPKFLLRTPSLPIDLMEEVWQAKTADAMEIRLKEIWRENELFRESIWLSSAGLHERLVEWAEKKEATDQDLGQTCLKYLIRMCSRATPFSLMAGNSIGTWGKKRNLELPGNDRMVRKTTLNGDATFQLEEHLQTSKTIQLGIRWHFNNSFYTYGDRFRFLRWGTNANGKQRFEISSVIKTPHLELLRSNCPNNPLSDMAELLVKEYGVGEEDAMGFLDQLIEEQILRSELDAPVIGAQHLDHMLKVMDQPGTAGLPEAVQLKGLASQLKELDEGVEGWQQRYAQLETEFRELGVKLMGRSLFHVECYKPLGDQATLPYRIPGQVRKGLQMLLKLSTADRSARKRLSDFANEFSSRYEYREVPLMEVLDSDLGIGYATSGGLQNEIPLLVGAVAPRGRNLGGVRDLRWNHSYTLMLRKLLQARDEKVNVIELRDEDVASLRGLPAESFPPVLRATMTLLDSGDPDKPIVHLMGAGDVAPTNILGRFGMAYSEVKELEAELLQAESEATPEGILVEFNYVPEDAGVFCILSRSTRRSHTLSFMAHADIPDEEKLSVEDIVVRVENGKVILRSKSLNQRILPRISTAHNFNRKTHPICEFIGSLQYQECNHALRLAWGPLVTSYSHLPEVRYKGVVLAPECWNFFPEFLAPLLQPGVNDDTVKEFVKEWGLPKRVVTSEYDMTLVLDLETEMGRALFLKSIPKGKAMDVTAYIEPSASVQDAEGRAYAHQVMAFFTREANQPKAPSRDSFMPRANVRPPSFSEHVFPPGSEWVYFKAYGGAKPLEEWLVGEAWPAIRQLQAQGLIDHWFFLRFYDHGAHLRLRLHLSDLSHFQAVVQSLSQLAMPEMELGRMQTLSLDTYVRETMRYGEKVIPVMEKAFAVDSEFVPHCIRGLGWPHIRENDRWMLILGLLDQILEVTGWDVATQVSFLQRIQRPSIDFKHANRKYKENSAALEELTKRAPEGHFVELYPVLEARGQHLTAVVQAVEKVWGKPNLDGFENCIVNLMHLCVNRMALDSPVGQEGILLRILYNHKQKMLHLKDQKENAH